MTIQAYSIYHQQMMATAHSAQRGDQTAYNRLEKLVNFCKAAEDGNLKKVKELIGNVDVNQPSPDYQDFPTALFLAAQEGHTDIMRFLLQNGAGVDIGTQDRTPLWWAAHNGKNEAVKVLVENKANLEAKDNKLGATSIGVAAFQGHFPVVQELINARANIDCTDSQQNTPLTHAVLCGHASIVDLLLQSKANPNQPGSNNITPLSAAVSLGHETIAISLIRAGATIENKNELLRFSIKKGNFEMVKLLLSKGADVNPQDLPRVTRSPLMEAAYKGHVDICAFLLDQGAELDRANDQGYRALDYAVMKNRLKVIDLLISKNTSVVDVLFIAVIEEFEEAIRKLHAAGADINRDDGNMTLLCDAMLENKFKSAAILLDLGAESHVGFVKDKIPLSHSLLPCEKSRLECFKLLFEKRPGDIHQVFGEERNTLLHNLAKTSEATENEDVELVDLLFKHGIDLNSTNKLGQTPMHCAAAEGKVAIMQKLISLGAILEPIDLEGNTPLLSAARGGKKECMELLLSMQANPAHQNLEGADIGWISCITGNLKLIEFIRPHLRTYKTLADQFNFPDSDLKVFKLRLKQSASQYVEQALKTYEEAPRGLFQLKHKTRVGFVQMIRSTLNSFQEREETQIGDILGLVQQAIQTIQEKKLHGRKGPENSTLYQKLKDTLKQVDELVGVVKDVLGSRQNTLIEELLQQKVKIQFNL